MTINTLIQDLKSAGQDYEFYPTWQEAVNSKEFKGNKK